MNELYLRPDVKVEPLIWNWYAWPHLIPPFTAGCNILDRHIKIMNSYIQAPEIHAEAVKNPKLAGGPFIDLNESHVEDIKQLLNITKADCINLINLAVAIKEFDRLLQMQAQGDSLEQLYQLLPDDLKGMVELTYDLNNHPSLRLIEPLVYNKFYQNGHQSIALSLLKGDDRPFVMSTPRIEKENEVYIGLPFNDKKWDILFSMRHSPRSSEEINKIFNIPDDKIQLFNQFFTNVKPEEPKTSNYNKEGIRIRYFGHACVMLQVKGLSILIDPVLSYKVKSSLERFSFDDLPDTIDYVLLTHNHQDHVLFETLLQIRHKIKCIVLPNNQKNSLADPSLRLILNYIGFDNCKVLEEFEKLVLEDGEIIGLPFIGEHSDLNIQTKLVYLINLQGKKFIFAADASSPNPELYKYIAKETGEIDYLFLGMECDGAPLTWLYGPLLTKTINRAYDHARQLSGSNFDRAWPLVEYLKCKNVFIYAMGQEPWLNYIMALKYTEDSIQIREMNRLLVRCREEGINAEKLFLKYEAIL